MFGEYPRKLGSNSETQERFWAAVLWHSILLIPLLPFMAELLQGSTYMDRLCNKVHPMMQTLFLNNETVFQENNVHTHAAGTVWFSHGLKTMKMNLNIFPGQLSHQI
jgi:hypothetical protein